MFSTTCARLTTRFVGRKKQQTTGWNPEHVAASLFRFSLTARERLTRRNPTNLRYKRSFRCAEEKLTASMRKQSPRRPRTARPPTPSFRRARPSRRATLRPAFLHRSCPQSYEVRSQRQKCSNGKWRASGAPKPNSISKSSAQRVSDPSTPKRDTLECFI